MFNQLIKIENDEVIHYNKEVSKIDKIYKEVLDTPEDTYNFEVEDCHTYYVTDSDVLVHNKCTTEIIGKAHGSEAHQAEINRIATQMESSGDYSKVS